MEYEEPTSTYRVFVDFARFGGIFIITEEEEGGGGRRRRKEHEGIGGGGGGVGGGHDGFKVQISALSCIQMATVHARERYSRISITAEVNCLFDRRQM